MALREAVGKWEPAIENALQYDKWGQVVESTDLYQQMKHESTELLRDGDLNTEQRNNVSKFLAVLEQRLQNIRHHSHSGAVSGGKRPSETDPGINHHTMEKISKIRNFLLNNEPWPIQISSIEIDKDRRSHMEDDIDDAVVVDNRGLLFPPRILPGQRVLKIHIQSIGLKDALDYLDPFITVSLRSGPHASQLVEPVQSTPYPKHKREAQLVVFDQAVFILKALDDIPAQANIFLEFQHYKPKKDKVSVRCWSMLSYDEFMEEGSKKLEIYAKPAEYSAKKFHKHSNKPLYMAVSIHHLSGG